VILDLRQHGGDEVESLLDFGKVFQDSHHARVVLKRVQTGPGELIFAGPQILVERLVHVPEETERSHGSAKKHLTGRGGEVPLIPSHRMSFSSSSSMRSAAVKSRRADRAAVAVFAGLRWVSEIRGVSME